MVAEVALRIGTFGATSRTAVTVPDAQFPFSIDSPFQDLLDCVNQRVDAGLAAYDQRTTREDRTVYLCPTPMSPQKVLITLNSDNYRARITAARAVYDKRRNNTGEFVFELFVFAVKVAGAQASQRATQSRVADAAVSIGSFLREKPDVRVGEIARTHWAVTQARRPTGSAVEIPTTATFLQAQHVDAMRDAIAAPPAQSDFGVVRARIMGSDVMEVHLNVDDLRRLLGLPAHSLLAEGIFRSFVPPPMPEEDVPDLDHEYSDDEAH